MNINPNAIALWIVLSGGGYLMTGDLQGAIAGLVAGAALSVMAGLFL